MCISILKTPELAMNPSQRIVTVCNEKKRSGVTEKKLRTYFLEAVMYTDDEEHERAECVYIQIMNGLDYCSDENDDD